MFVLYESNENNYMYQMHPTSCPSINERLNKPSATGQMPQHQENMLQPCQIGAYTWLTCSQLPQGQRSGHLAEGLTVLLLFCHALRHPLLVAAQLVVSLDLQKLHLLFASVSFPLQPHELKWQRKRQSHWGVTNVRAPQHRHDNQPTMFAIMRQKSSALPTASSSNMADCPGSSPSSDNAGFGSWYS